MDVIHYNKLKYNTKNFHDNFYNEYSSLIKLTKNQGVTLLSN